jgi:hypothetical protein
MGSIQQKQHEIATLNSLADQIKELAAKMTKDLAANNIPPVTLEADSPVRYESLPGDLFMTRQLLEDALQDMWILSQGPSDSVFNYVHMAVPDASCLNILNQFDFWNAVPVDGEASFEEIAEKIELPVEVVSRVLDHAVTMRFFTKASPAATCVRHTSRSAALAKDPGLIALVQTVLDETGPPMMVLPEALRKYSQGKKEMTRNMDETAFRLCHSGGVWGDFKNSWEFIENDGVKEGEVGWEKKSKGWRQRNFVKFMAYIKDLFKTEDIMLNALDWAAAGNATVVDVSHPPLTQRQSDILTSLPDRWLSRPRLRHPRPALPQPNPHRPRPARSRASFRKVVSTRSALPRLLPHTLLLRPPAPHRRHLHAQVDLPRLARRRMHRHPARPRPRAQARRARPVHRLCGQAGTQR